MRKKTLDKQHGWHHGYEKFRETFLIPLIPNVSAYFIEINAKIENGNRD